MQLKNGDALIVVDVQRDFLPGGSLAVPHGDEVIPAINSAIRHFRSTGLPVVATGDSDVVVLREAVRAVNIKANDEHDAIAAMRDTGAAIVDRGAFNVNDRAI